MPNTILDTGSNLSKVWSSTHDATWWKLWSDPTAFLSVLTASDGIVDLMWGPDGWSRQVNIFILFIEIFRHLFDQVPAWQFTAKFKDSQDVIISFDKVWCLCLYHYYHHKLINDNTSLSLFYDHKTISWFDHRMWEMRLSALLTPWNLPRCSILKASFISITHFVDLDELEN